jgi:phage-related protein
MAAVAFTPPVAPSDPLDDARQPRVNRVQFGNNYSQRSGDGINADPEKPTVKWEHLTMAEYQSIWNFFTGLAGVGAFTYALPWDSTPVTKKYICAQYSRTKHSVNDYDITCTWEEVNEA